MKNLIILTLAILSLSVFHQKGFAQSKPDLAGYTISDGQQTYDFYSDKVIYHANGSDISRRGDYYITPSKNVIHGLGSRDWNITINIYVGNRTVTIKGSFTSHSNGIQGSKTTIKNFYIDGKPCRISS